MVSAVGLAVVTDSQRTLKPIPGSRHKLLVGRKKTGGLLKAVLPPVIILNPPWNLDVGLSFYARRYTLDALAAGATTS